MFWGERFQTENPCAMHFHNATLQWESPILVITEEEKGREKVNFFYPFFFAYKYDD